jgi:peptide/nickel transport system substrate-binding protein
VRVGRGSPGRALLLSAACVVLSACGGRDAGRDSSNQPGRRILRVAYDREIDVLNPFTSQNLVDVEFSMMEGLITTDEHNTYVPVLAKEIPTEANGLVARNPDGTVDMTWPLQEGVRWHDGEPFTSADVCFTWRFVTSPNSQVYNRDQYLGIVGCRMPDEHTVVFRWDGVYGYYGGLFEAVLPEHVLGGMTTEEIVSYEPFNRGPEAIGTGPFRFADWKTGEYIRVVRNDDYWRGPEYPRIDEIVWSFIPDPNTRLNAMRARQHHYAQLLPTQVPEVRGLGGYQVHLVSSNTFLHFDVSLNTENARRLFSDPKVRLALFHAVDRGAIADKLMQGTVEVATSPINPSSPYHTPGVPPLDFDPERARRMLDDAGWRSGPDGVRARAGERFAFTMLNRAGSTDRIAVAQVIQAQLRDVGVEVTFETLESAAWTQRWRSGRWEAIVSAWFLPADPSVTGLYACDGPNNMTGFCDPELDALMEESDRHLDFAARKPLLDSVQVRLARRARSLPLYYNVVPQLLSTTVGGFRPSGTNFGSFWNLWEWTLR